MRRDCRVPYPNHHALSQSATLNFAGICGKSGGDELCDGDALSARLLNLPRVLYASKRLSERRPVLSADVPVGRSPEKREARAPSATS